MAKTLGAQRWFGGLVLADAEKPCHQHGTCLRFDKDPVPVKGRWSKPGPPETSKGCGCELGGYPQISGRRGSVDFGVRNGTLLGLFSLLAFRVGCLTLSTESATFSKAVNHSGETELFSGEQKPIRG